jgi:hypothetical protein
MVKDGFDGGFEDAVTSVTGPCFVRPIKDPLPDSCFFDSSLILLPEASTAVFY